MRSCTACSLRATPTWHDHAGAVIQHPLIEAPRLPLYRKGTNRWGDYAHTSVFDEGIIVGQRFLAEYKVHTEREYDEYGMSCGDYTISQQVPGTSRRAWLVSYDLHRKPVLVLDEHVEAVEEKIPGQKKSTAQLD